MDYHNLINKKINEFRKFLGLENYDIRLEITEEQDHMAGCNTDPEYLKAVISVNIKRLETGDDLDEIVFHELTHVINWPLHQLAEDFSNSLKSLIPEKYKEILGYHFDEIVRVNAELVTTTVADSFYRFYKIIKEKDREIKDLKDSIKNSKDSTRIL